MAKSSDVKSLMSKYFPKCPICLQSKGYDVLGADNDYVSCKKCSATWQSDDFKNCQDLKNLKLTQASNMVDLTGKVLLRKSYQVVFWLNWRENWRKEQENIRECEIQAFENEGEPVIDCQYLKENNCLSIVNNQEAQEVRSTTCRSENPKACCYICDFYEDCEISCNYLGKVEHKQKNIKAIIKITRCPLCKSRMLHSEVKFRTGGWSGLMQLLPFGSWGELGEELLPVEVYVCVRCGKIELMAPEKTRQRIIERR